MTTIFSGNDLVAQYHARSRPFTVARPHLGGDVLVTGKFRDEVVVIIVHQMNFATRQVNGFGVDGHQHRQAVKKS